MNDTELARYATDRSLRQFKYFLRWVRTYDEAEGLDKEPYPIHLEYTQKVADELQNATEPTWVPKSRRILMTWTMCAYLLWKGMRNGTTHAFVQTNKEDDADFLIEWRVKYIWDHLPYWLKFVAFGGNTTAKYTYNKFVLPNGAKIWGVPQGPDVFRQYTPSVLFIDEAAKQDKFEEALTAIQPFYEKNTQVFYVSSARPTIESEFSRVIVNTKPKGEILQLCKGVKFWELEHGGNVLEVHYSADPNKDPDRDGKYWYEEAGRKTVGGHEGAKWRQEMEIEFDAQSGELVYPVYVDEAGPNGHLVEPFDPGLFEQAWRVIDWGLRNETCCLWIGYLDDVYFVYREFYEKAPTIEYFKTKLAIAAQNPNEPDYVATLIDPAADRANYQGMKTTMYLLNSGANKIGARKANNSSDGIALVNEWFHDKRLRFFTSVANTRWECTNYRWRDWTEATQKYHNLKEEPVDKNNHAMDCLKYFANFRRGFENRRRQVIEVDPYEQQIQAILDEEKQKDRYYSSGVLSA